MHNHSPAIRHRPTNARRFTAVAILSLLMLAIIGYGKSTRITTRAAGHQISADIVGDHSIDSQPDHGVISSQFGKIVIERARVKLDDAPWTKIPEDVSVEVSISKGKLWLAAGPVTTSRTIR
jgi:hypothetical protein